MIKIDLITGFLGAGKTTFLRRYARYLLDRGLNIGILENDYGAVNVDMMLLQDLMGDKCELEMIAGGCCQDCHRRRFKSKLIAMGMCGYDRVLIEPSGIYDMDEFFDVLREEPLERWYEIGNVFAVVDAGLEPELSEESDFILASETASAGAVLLSKVRQAGDREIAGTIDHLNRAMEKAKCARRFGDDIWKKDWEEFTDWDFARLMRAGFRNESYEKRGMNMNDGYDSLCFMNLYLGEERLRTAVSKILQDPACGSVFRIKGFTQLPGGSWIQLNATRKQITADTILEGQEVIIVIGEALEEEVIRNYLEGQEEHK